MRKQQLLAITTKPLQAKHTKPKLVWPGYRELLNLDRQRTQKVESDDENQNYLEKLLKKELQEKKKHEQELRAQKLQEERDRKIEEKRKRMLRRLERKRMLEDGLIDPNDPEQQHLLEQEPSQESILEPVQTEAHTTEHNVVSAKPAESKSLIQKPPFRLLSKNVSPIHEKRCKSVEKLRKQVHLQPYIITGGLYLTERKALPADYEKFLQRLKYKTVEPELDFNEDDPETQKRPATTKLNQQRLEALSKPKSASSTRLKQYAWTEFTHKNKDEEKCDFNFVVKQQVRQNELRRRNTLQKRQSMNLNRAPPNDKLTVSQLFLRKMFVSTNDQKMFRTDLAINRRKR